MKTLSCPYDFWLFRSFSNFEIVCLPHKSRLPLQIIEVDQLKFIFLCN